MKKFLMFLCTLTLVFGVANANATPFTDNFYGTGVDGSYVEIWENHSVALDFNLLSDGFTTDMIIDSGFLDFTFSGADCSDETVRISAGLYDGDTLIREIDYDLGYWQKTVYGERYKEYYTDLFGRERYRWKRDVITPKGYVREYASLSIDLAAEGLLGYLDDGLFTSIVLSPRDWCGDNDIRLDSATLTVDAAAPVPEPATILLMGLGLFGMVGIRRRMNK